MLSRFCAVSSFVSSLASAADFDSTAWADLPCVLAEVLLARWAFRVAGTTSSDRAATGPTMRWRADTGPPLRYVPGDLYQCVCRPVNRVFSRHDGSADKQGVFFLG